MWPHQAYNIPFDDDDEDERKIPLKTKAVPYDYVFSAAPSHVYPSPQDPTAIDMEEQEDERLFQQMIAQNKMALLYETFDKRLEEETNETRIVAASPLFKPVSPQADEEPRTLHRLYEEYMSPHFLDRIRLKFDEIYDTVCVRAKPHKNEVLRDRPQIEAIIDMFVKRMVLDMLCVDKASIKAKEMCDRIDALYYMRYDSGTVKKPTLVEGVKNNFIHHDYVDRIRLAREKAASDHATDAVFTHFSEPKKRGRHAKDRVEEVWNEIETIASQYIPSKKQQEINNTAPRSATTDLNPIFERNLTILNQAIPRLCNHGWFTEKLLRSIRSLDSNVWPLHGLMLAMHNANYIIHAKRVVVGKFDRTKRRIYCCFSGLEIKTGETVTWIKVVENDAERLAAWRENTMVLERPFDAPEFKRSVSSFYMKTELCCPISLFYAPFSEAYKSRFASYFAPKTLTLDLKRKASIHDEDTTITNKKTKKTQTTRIATHPIAQLMLHLATLYTTGEGDRWFHRELVKYRKNYAQERTEIFSVFEAMSEKSFTIDLQRVIYYCFNDSPYYDTEIMETTEQLRLVADCLDVVLDFFEIVTATPDESSVLMKRLAFSIKQRKSHNPTYRNTLATLIDQNVPESGALSKCITIPFFSHFSFFFLILFEYLFAREIALCDKPTGSRLTHYQALLDRLHLS